jgi:hypothetical protein
MTVGYKALFEGDPDDMDNSDGSLYEKLIDDFKPIEALKMLNTKRIKAL